VSRRLAVRDARLALPNLDNITIRIANVAARLAVLVVWLCDKLRYESVIHFITERVTGMGENEARREDHRSRENELLRAQGKTDKQIGAEIGEETRSACSVAIETET
jgi:hypothetical protein